MTENPIWAQSLNPVQLEAVRECDRPLLVIAGAGSGKTRVLTYKIAYLIEERGYMPWHILALTFTNKAAREMNSRIATILTPDRAAGLWSGTFHSIFARILRAEAGVLGFPKDYTIYDTTDSRSLLKTIIKELGLDDKVYKPALVQSRISDAKNRLILPDEYADDTTINARNERDGIGQTSAIYREYQRRLQTAGAMDFDDLLVNTYLLLYRHPEIRQYYAERFKYILVDEYQDTNFAQHSIVRLLTQDNPHICVVGDDAQSIYSFRGANIDNILKFTKIYQDAVTIKLEQNYRSTSTIVDAANAIIQHNKHQIPKNVFSHEGQGEPISICEAFTDKEEAQNVVREIARCTRPSFSGEPAPSYDEIAILYRTNSQSRSFEEALKASQIPYRVYGSQSFYQRKEIKDAIAYLRLLINPADEEAFRRVVNYPARGIGNTSLAYLQNVSRQCGLSLWDVACDPERYGSQWPRGAAAKLKTFCHLIVAMREMAETMPTLYDTVLKVLELSGMQRDLAQDSSVEGESRRDNIEELLGDIHTYDDEVMGRGETRPSLSDYLAQKSLLTDADEAKDDKPRVTLMTMHAAKGLEFDTVFVTGLEENLFPSPNAATSPRQMEEERRLMYVAVTRAKRHLVLSYAHSRWRFREMQYSEPSMFLYEIPQHLTQKHGITRGIVHPRPNNLSNRSPRPISAHQSKMVSPEYPARMVRVQPPVSPQPDEPVVAIGNLHVGTIIKHDRFGVGQVVGLEGQGGNAKATVNFEVAGTKKLLLQFAKFDILTK